MKIRLLIMTFMLLCTVGVAQADTEVTVDNIKYTIAGKSARVTGFVTGIENADIQESVSYSGKDYPVTSIGKYAFNKCTRLTSVTIPSSVTEISGGVFFDCTRLKSIEVTSDNKFYSSSDDVLFDKAQTILIAYPAGKQNSSYIVPNTVTIIGYCAFAYCSGLTSVSIPDGVTTIGHYAFRDCSSLTSVTIPSSVTEIGAGAFSGLTSVIISGNVTSIGEGAFSGLTSVIISEGVTEIGDWAFADCSGLTSVSILGSVTTIGDGAFWGCSGLEDIYCAAQTPPTISAYTFETYTAILHVPAGAKAAYESAEGWMYFTEIVEIGAVVINGIDAESPVTYHAGILSLPDTNAPAMVYVYAQDGKCVWTCSMAAGERACDLSRLVQGIYFVRLKAGNEVSFLKIVR